MTIHALRDVLELVPEAEELCKQASIEDGFPTNSKDSTIASALKLEYMVKVAGEKVSLEDVRRVNLAARLYGVMDKVAELSTTLQDRALIKQAAELVNEDQDLRIAEDYIETQTCGFMDIEKVASASSELYDAYEADIKSPVVKRYACAEVFVKSAAVAALKSRHNRAPTNGFDKLASIIEASDEDRFSQEEIRSIADCVTKLDKRAGITTDGYNFYKEAFITKEAAASSLMITLDRQKVPVENILRVPVGSILGDDVAKEMGSDPYTIKAVAESLPSDMQKLLLQRVR